MVGRDAELAQLALALQAAAGGSGSFLIIEGEAGLGQSRLLGMAAGMASALGMDVRRAEGRHLERELSFGVASQLLHELTNGFLAQRRAGADDRRDAHGGRTAGRRRTDLLTPELEVDHRHRLHTLCTELAADRPLALVIDDAQWVDRATLHFLLYLAHRIDELPVAILLAGLPIHDSAMGNPFEEMERERAVGKIKLAPLSRASATQLVRQLVLPDASESLCTACYEASGGNVMLLKRLAVEVAERGLDFAGGAATGVQTLAPPSVAQQGLLWLSSIDPDAVELARAVAVLGNGCVMHSASEVAGLEVEHAARLADRLIVAGIFTHSERVGFKAPVLGRALYQDMAPTARLEAELRAACELRARGRAGERVAGHLVRARRSAAQWVSDELEGAAAEAMARGAPRQATEYLLRALDEPPPAARRGQIMLALGKAQSRVGDRAGLQRFDQAAAQLPDDAPEQMALALDSAGLLWAAGMPDRAIERLSAHVPVPVDTESTAQELRIAMVHALGRRLHDSERVQAPRPDGHSSADGVRTVAVWDAMDRALSGAVRTPGHDFGHLGPEGWEPSRDGVDAWEHALARSACALGEELAQAELALAPAIRAAQARGTTLVAAGLLQLRAVVSLRRGALNEAETHANAALQSVSGEWPAARVVSHAVLAEVATERGHPEVAAFQSAAARGAFGGGDALVGALVEASHGKQLLGGGDPKAAIERFAACGAWLEGAGLELPALVGWRVDQARAHVRLGELDTARELVGRERALVEASGGPGALGRTLHAQSWVDGDHSGELLAAAVGTLAGSDLESTSRAR